MNQQGGAYAVARARTARALVGIFFATLLCLGAALAQDGQEIQSLLLRGIPSESDPSALVKAHRDSRVLPFHPVDQMPLYGLPHGFVQTSVGRLALRIDDLSFPGKVPIRMGYVYDSGASEPLPSSPLPFQPMGRLAQDLGGGWILAYSDYIVPTNGGYVLQASDGSSIPWVPDLVGSTWHKEIEFPSDHLTLTTIDADTLEEDRADMTKWRYELDTQSGQFLLSTITDRHGNTLTLTYDHGYIRNIQTSQGYWIAIHRPIYDLTVVQFPVSRITSMEDSAGRSVSFDYSAGGYLTSWTDANGKVWHGTCQGI